MIRVAQVVGKMNGGGVEHVVMNYYRHMNRERVQFDILADSDSKIVPAEEIQSLGGRIFFIPPYQHQLDYQKELRSLFRENRWTIVHSHINTLSVFPLRAAKIAKVPVRIAHSHSSLGGGEGENAKNMLKVILRHASNLYPTERFACSDVAGEWLFGENVPFELIRNAIDLSRYYRNCDVRTQVRKELNLSDDVFVVGHIGRFVPPKNHLRILDIFEAVHAINPNSVLILIGEGPLMTQVKERASDLGIMNSVKFLGQRADANRFYQAFDAFCLPSFYEGFPVVGVECQAAGVPILASTKVTREMAITSLIEFEPLETSSEGWARKLLSMRGRVLSRSDSLALKEYDIGDNAKHLEELYCSFIDKANEQYD